MTPDRSGLEAVLIFHYEFGQCASRQNNTINVLSVQRIRWLFATGRRKVDGRYDIIHPFRIEGQLTMHFPSIYLSALPFACTTDSSGIVTMYRNKFVDLRQFGHDFQNALRALIEKVSCI
jgi:hypothetical protein